MKTVSEQASAATWTCEITLARPGLPDLRALARGVRETRTGAWLRGVEVTVEGRVEVSPDGAALVDPRTGERLRLAPLGRKVQWDARAGREQAATDDERGAYRMLLRTHAGPVDRVRVTGPLREGDEGRSPILEVRHYVPVR